MSVGLNVALIVDAPGSVHKWLHDLPDDYRLKCQLYSHKTGEVDVDFEETIVTFLKSVGVLKDEVICFISKPPPVVTIVRTETVQRAIRRGDGLAEDLKGCGLGP